LARALDEGATKIVLDMDSPGGMCMGLEEAARAVEKARDFVRVEAVSDSLICSACYRLAIEADAIYTTQTAEVGSIGVISSFLDQSERYKMAGVKPVLFTSGDLKGTGFPGTSLSEAQADNIKQEVAYYFSLFQGAVRNRRMVEDDSMRGQVFSGDIAEQRGLIDYVIDDIGERFEL
jgi:ClpP class serine protease